MASTAALELLVQLESKAASQGLDELGEKGGGLGDLLKGGLAIAGGAVLGFGAVLVGATKAAADEQVGITRLNTTLKNAAKGWDGNTEAIEDYIDKQTDLAFQDDELRDSLGFLVGQTQDLTEAQNLQALAMDLARAKGISLEQATKAVGKVDNDSIGILKKLGIQVTDQMTKEEALTAIREASAGQAEAYANSAAGSMEIVQNAFGDAFETIGGAVLPLVEGPLKAFAEWVKSKEVQDGIAAFAKGIGEFLAGAFNFLKDAFIAVLPFIQSAWAYLTSQPVIDFAKGLAQGIGELLVGAFNTLKDVFIAVAPFVKSIWDYLTSATVVENVKGMATQVGTFLAGAFTTIKDIFIALQPTMKAIWDFLTSEGFLTTVGNIANAIGTVLGGALNVLKTVIDTVGPPIGDFFKGLLDIKLPTISFDDLNTALDNFQKAIATGADPLAAFTKTLTDLKVPAEDAAAAYLTFKYAVEGGYDPTEAATQILTTLKTKLDEAGAAAEANRSPFERFGEYMRIGWNQATTDFIGSFPILLSAMSGWLVTGAQMLWTAITTVWVPNFMTFVGDILKKLPGELAIVANQLWIWLQNGATILGVEIQKWTTSFWMWITGPNGVIAGIGAKLNMIWTLITQWVDGVIKGIGATVTGIGTQLVAGIRAGINTEWRGFLIWLNGKMADLPQVLKDFLGIKSPSQLMSDIFSELPPGMSDGINRTFPAFLVDVAGKMKLVSGEITGGLQQVLTDADMTMIAIQAGLVQVGSNITGAIQAGMEAAYGGLMTSWMSFFDGLWGEAVRRAAEILALVNFGTAGSGTPYAGGNPVGAGGGTGGGRVLGSTMAGGGGGGNVYITVNAGWGSDGRGIAQAILEELEYALGDQIAIRNGSRTRP